MAKIEPTAADKRYWSKLSEYGCLICRQPAEIHHITTGVGMGQKAAHRDVIPLCHAHHRTGGSGVAIHAGKRTWETIYGSEVELLAEMRDIFYG